MQSKGEGDLLISGKCRVFCIQSTEQVMTFQLLKLHAAPDLVDQVYQALLADIAS